MYEHRRQPLLTHRRYLARIVRHALLAAALIAGSLAIGTVGYHVFGGLRWIDALLNASMILTGMGPVDPMPDDRSKLFASAYAIFSGIAFLSTVGVLVAPVVHRFLHGLHLESDAGD